MAALTSGSGQLFMAVQWSTLSTIRTATFTECTHVYRRHQERGDVLLIENARLGQDLETQKLNLADINEFLTSELEASSSKLRQMEGAAAALQQELDEAKDTHTVSTSSLQPAHLLVALWQCKAPAPRQGVTVLAKSTVDFSCLACNVLSATQEDC